MGEFVNKCINIYVWAFFPARHHEPGTAIPQSLGRLFLSVPPAFIFPFARNSSILFSYRLSHPLPPPPSGCEIKAALSARPREVRASVLFPSRFLLRRFKPSVALSFSSFFYRLVSLFAFLLSHPFFTFLFLIYFLFSSLHTVFLFFHFTSFFFITSFAFITTTSPKDPLFPSISDSHFLLVFHLFPSHTFIVGGPSSPFSSCPSSPLAPCLCGRRKSQDKQTGDRGPENVCKRSTKWI